MPDIDASYSVGHAHSGSSDFEGDLKELRATANGCPRGRGHSPVPIRAPRDDERGTSGARAVTSALPFNPPALHTTSTRSDAHRTRVPGSSTIRLEAAVPRASVDALQLRSLPIATLPL
ncbi:hypothetical protein HETIRDRAFT_454702 [Heterobasidion irregulare TC 32-1]|uniref:Uncharacterized protein n=1 Tax=Heterobasidion irregulare (strain TC 32-1) TaxID=747525 RepID=W4JV02_HETIT|nr:uncharacterized protein HETIRDRAFT_454702 [Heterobasidion irregulare TC 32-1]ETW77393.1 hypothetical protein HETIRDRAFT_454702 [Heterobasidion irregulare TC 32-1]